MPGQAKALMKPEIWPGLAWPISAWLWPAHSLKPGQAHHYHQCTKQIEVRWHWVRDLVKEGQIMVTKCKGTEQTADVLTKALPRPKHRQHVEGMGLTTV